jgi:hypothetical protein
MNWCSKKIGAALGRFDRLQTHLRVQTTLNGP